MDLEIGADIQKVGEILEAAGFKSIKVKGGVIEAKLKDGWERIHVLGTKMNGNSTYLDVHRDALIHIAFIGVDYLKKPREVCERILSRAARMGIAGKIIGGTSWLNRKNEAIFGGMRMEKGGLRDLALISFFLLPLMFEVFGLITIPIPFALAMLLLTPTRDPPHSDQTYGPLFRQPSPSPRPS
jgi:hypothetical protein